MIAFYIPIQFLLGCQIELRELKLLTWRYHYNIKALQWISYGSLILSVGIFVLAHVQYHQDPHAFLLFSLLLSGWLLGLLFRNWFLGVAHRKALGLVFHCHVKSPAEDADYFPARQPLSAPSHLPLIDVKERGILPNTKQDLLPALQRLIDQCGTEGGACLWFPKGKYLFKTGHGKFLRINHSHIWLMGETDSNGKPLAEFISTGATTEGSKNPWLSPFFVTTGELLQPSNEFFGLQFRKRKQQFMRSNSLSDPGSDGNILTPDFATRIIAPSREGETLLHVEDSRMVGKYILLGLYNTTPDGNLIREILGVQQLRPEWKVANRAGEEEAPSYQWLVEIKGIVDEHTVETVRPLLRDIPMQYEPAIFNVPMLEDITVCNLRIRSTWNGRFHHHGFPIYYSIRQSQEMDYGWNGINFKRVAHGRIHNVELRNYTNPLYVLDSRDIEVSCLDITGHDGHQGIKIYEHCCDCQFHHITFRSHFADMMGGEGNAYGNVFRHVRYLNPVFKPVDFDFHGFSEGPMSPPAHNLFEHIDGFRHIKSAGSITHLPSLAQGNVFRHLHCQGERRGDFLFYAMTYRPKIGLVRLVTAAGFAVAMMQKQKRLCFWKHFRQKLKDIDTLNVPRSEHKQFFQGTITEDIDTWCRQ